VVKRLEWKGGRAVIISNIHQRRRSKMNKAKNNRKKAEQLGMPYGTACGRLRKMVLFDILKKYNLNNCYRCGETINNIKDLSMEHKKAWLDSSNPCELFFDINNIAFSHLKCNIVASRNSLKGKIFSKHGTLNRYNRGCRCDLCKNAKLISSRRWNETRKIRGYR